MKDYILGKRFVCRGRKGCLTTIRDWNEWVGKGLTFIRAEFPPGYLPFRFDDDVVVAIKPEELESLEETDELR